MPFPFVAPPEWWDKAQCRIEQTGLQPFFEPDYLVIRMCRSCEARQECLAEGLLEPYGVWGGFVPGERRRLRTRLEAGATLEEATAWMDEWRTRHGR